MNTENSPVPDDAADYARRAASPPARTGEGRRVFRPSPAATLALLAVLALSFALGHWQWRRAAAKRLQHAEAAERLALPPLALTAAATPPSDAVHARRVTARGRYEPARQFLLDNQIRRGQAGFHVFTPLRIGAGDLRVLVDRGWIPGDAARTRLPSVDTPVGEVVVEGVALVPLARPFTLAPDPAGASVRQVVDIEAYRRQASFPVADFIVRLAPGSDAGGFIREWPAVGAGEAKHIGYALQWWGLGVAAAGVWFFGNWRRA